MKGGEKLKNSFRFVYAVLALSAMKSLLQHAYGFGFFLLFILATGSLRAQESGFVSLFDGQSLNGWVGNKSSYLVKDGMIVIEPKGGGGGNLYTEKEYGNFILRFEFQLTPGANNGLGIHAPLEGDAAYVGKEFQILDNEAEKYAGLQAYQYHGSLYGVMPAKRGFLRPTGEWNQQEVHLNHPYVTIILNGEVILEGNYLEASQSGTLDKKEHPGLLRSRGHIGFLGHGDLVRFRNIKIKELP
jgi:hypothetical protein